MTNDVLINMNKVQKHLKEIADNARDNGYSHEVEVIQSVQDNLLDFVEESRSALAPVDVEGLKRETSKMLLEHLQKTWYQGIQGMSFEQFCVNSVIDHLAACGCFGVQEGYALVPLSDLPPSIFIPLPEGRVLGETQKIESIVSIEDAYKIAQCLIKAMLKAAPKKEGV